MKRKLLIVSPIFIIGAGHIAARILYRFLGVWTWVPLTLLFWGLLGILIVWGKGPEAVKRWTRPARRSPSWTVIALLVGLIPLPILLLNFPLLADPVVFVCWLLFALINPWFEEFYWRGLVLDATAAWPAWASGIYSTLLFVIFHPLVAGVFSIANRHWMVAVALLLMGAAWTAAYRKTGTLRWAVASHVLADLCSLAVPVFLNLYIPPNV